jgi:hypothetical protein
MKGSGIPHPAKAKRHPVVVRSLGLGWMMKTAIEGIIPLKIFHRDPNIHSEAPQLFCVL